MYKLQEPSEVVIANGSGQELKGARPRWAPRSYSLLPFGRRALTESGCEKRMSSDQAELLAPLPQFPLPAPRRCVCRGCGLWRRDPHAGPVLWSCHRQVGREGSVPGGNTASRAGPGFARFPGGASEQRAWLAVSEVSPAQCSLRAPLGEWFQGANQRPRGCRDVGLGAQAELDPLASRGGSCCWHW